MMFEVIKRRLLLSFLLLTTLLLAWSLFVTGEKMEKLTYAGDEKELSAEHRRGQPFKFARLVQQPPVVGPPPQLKEQLPPLVEPPPPLVEQPPPLEEQLRRLEEQLPPLVEQPPPIVEQPPPIVEQPPPPRLARRRDPEPPPPSPTGPPGKTP